MSSFNFSCPLCGKELKVEEDLRGQQAACPQCERTLVIPVEAAGQPQEKSPLKAVIIVLVIVALICAIGVFIGIRLAGSTN